MREVYAHVYNDPYEHTVEKATADFSKLLWFNAKTLNNEFFLLVPAAKRGTSLGLPRVFFFYLCRGFQALDVILDILDSGYLI